MLLSDFPQEIIEQIADCLSLEDKISCSLVCKSWKRVFQDTIYSDILINPLGTLQDVMTPSKDNPRKYHEIGHLVRYLSIGYYWHTTAEEIYTLQNTFPNIKYLYFVITPLDSNVFGSMADWNLWGSLTELYMHIMASYLPAMENSLVEAIVCLPLLKRLEIHGQMTYDSIIAFSVNDFETIHSHLKHLEYMKLSTSLLALCDTDIERIAKASPATRMKTFNLTSDKTNYRWLCYFARKYPNLHTLDLYIAYMLADIEEQRLNTKALFQQVPVSFQHLESLNLEYFHKIDGGDLLFMDKINFHDVSLKHISIEISVPYNTYYPDNLCDAPKNIAETCLEKLPKAIESFRLKCACTHTTPINLTGMKNSLCNLVILDINISVSVDIDTFLCAAPRLKSLRFLYSDIKVKDGLYNSERFELQSFHLYSSKIESDVLRFLSFHCRKLDTLSLSDTSAYGNFTTPGCQFIDMTYSSLQSLSIDSTSFIIKDNKECPDNRNITLITRPLDDIPPKQEYDPNILPAEVGDRPFNTHDEWFYRNNHQRMIRISKAQASQIMKFVSNYEENKRIAMEKAYYLKRRKLSKIWKKNFVFGYTKIDLGYVPNYYCTVYSS